LLALFYSSTHARSSPSFPTRRSSDLFPASTTNHEKASKSSRLAGRSWPASRQRFYATRRLAWATAAVTEDGIQARKESDLWRRRSEEHTSELQSLTNLVCRLLLEQQK